jgi:hypothetical protein
MCVYLKDTNSVPPTRDKQTLLPFPVEVNNASNRGIFNVGIFRRMMIEFVQLTATKIPHFNGT